MKYRKYDVYWNARIIVTYVKLVRNVAPTFITNAVILV